MKSFIPTLAGIVFYAVALSTTAIAGDARTAPGPDTEAALSSCAQKSLSAVIRPQADRSVEPPREIRLAHGTWHPCANDPNACGAGHSCCDGHCVKGACGD